MDEKVVPITNSFASEDKIENSLYPVYFGVSCAFFAVRLLSLPHDAGNERWSAIREKMLQGSAQLLGLLVWSVQREGLDGGGRCEILLKLKNAEREVVELKRIRREDAKANEKVVSIFAAQEQSWLIERKKLRQHIGALMSELRFQEKRKDQVVSEMNDKLKEMEVLVHNKEKALEEESEKRKQLEEKLKEVESVAEELREKAKRESQEHSSDLRKHKTAFIELVSNQRHLEADMSRALRQVEAKKRELESVLKQKEESVLMVQKLSAEIVKMHEDLEQKDKILSATLRKSKLDTAERQMLLKEVKLSKAKRKQAEMETERWKAVSESRQERHSLRNMLAKQANSRLEIVPAEKGLHSTPTGSSLSHVGLTKSQPGTALLSYEHHPEFESESEAFSPPFDIYSLHANEDLVDVKQVESWVRSEAERYAAVIEQRHHLEIDAFVEQLRLKDEKLEAFRWRLLSMELESKRLQSHVEGLNKEFLQLRHKSMKMEALLLEREEELTFLKEQLGSQLRSLSSQNSNFNASSHDTAVTRDSIWAQVKIIKRQPGEEEQETKTISVEMTQEEEASERGEGILSVDQAKGTGIILPVQSPDKDFDERKGSPSEEGSSSPLELDVNEKLAPSSSSSSPTEQYISKANSSQWRMDLHALGVAYKLKRLKQQLIMLERLRGEQESGEDKKESNDNEGEKETAVKDFLSLMSLLNKQVGRYQTLQGKVDDLCKRMHDCDLKLCRGDSSTTRTREKTKKLEHFLEETFQLQRYMVATGQKMTEIQSKIASGLVAVGKEIDKSTGFDMNRFSESVRTLFHDVQRGIEVRIARVIGDLEGTLACEGMIHLRR